MRGWVVDVETGQPIGDATVVVGPMRAHTRPDGQFEAMVPAGRARVQVESQEHVTGRREVAIGGTTVPTAFKLARKAPAVRIGRMGGRVDAREAAMDIPPGAFANDALVSVTYGSRARIAAAPAPAQFVDENQVPRRVYATVAVDMSEPPAVPARMKVPVPDDATLESVSIVRASEDGEWAQPVNVEGVADGFATFPVKENAVYAVALDTRKADGAREGYVVIDRGDGEARAAKVNEGQVVTAGAEVVTASRALVLVDPQGSTIEVAPGSSCVLEAPAAATGSSTPTATPTPARTNTVATEQPTIPFAGRVRTKVGTVRFLSTKRKSLIADGVKLEVMIGTGKLQAIGTAFTVKSCAGSLPVDSVEVVEGNVRFRRDGQDPTLIPMGRGATFCQGCTGKEPPVCTPTAPDAGALPPVAADGGTSMRPPAGPDAWLDATVRPGDATTTATDDALGNADASADRSGLALPDGDPGPGSPEVGARPDLDFDPSDAARASSLDAGSPTSSADGGASLPDVAATFDGPAVDMDPSLPDMDPSDADPGPPDLGTVDAANADDAPQAADGGAAVMPDSAVAMDDAGGAAGPDAPNFTDVPSADATSDVSDAGDAPDDAPPIDAPPGMPDGGTVMADAGMGTFLVTPSPHTFPATAVGSPTNPQMFTITNSGTGPIGSPIVFMLKGPSPGDYQLGTNTCGSGLAPAASCTVDVRFNPTVAGPRNADLEVSAAGVPTAFVNMFGSATPALSIMPGSMDFGTVTVGQMSASTRFTVKNDGDVPTQPLMAFLTGPNASDFVITMNTCIAAQLSKFGTCVVDVAAYPMAMGPRDATLQVGSSMNGFAMAMLKANYVAMGASLVAEPPNYTWGTVAKGVMGPELMVTFKNVGTMPTGTLGGSILSGAEFQLGQDNCIGLALNPAQSCTVKVRMNPTSAGMKTATLQATASPGGMPVAMLSGMGTDGLVTMPSFWDFGGVSVGQNSGTQQITIRNDGMSASGIIPGPAILLGADPAHFEITADTCYMQNLSMGGTCTVTVRFTPTAAGQRSANVMLMSGGPLGNVSADLKGNGL